eukprot:2462312-Pleurochrysis_carterae.AAC.5
MSCAQPASHRDSWTNANHGGGADGRVRREGSRACTRVSVSSTAATSSSAPAAHAHACSADTAAPDACERRRARLRDRSGQDEGAAKGILFANKYSQPRSCQLRGASAIRSTARTSSGGSAVSAALAAALARASPSSVSTTTAVTRSGASEPLRCGALRRSTSSNADSAPPAPPSPAPSSPASSAAAAFSAASGSSCSPSARAREAHALRCSGGAAAQARRGAASSRASRRLSWPLRAAPLRAASAAASSVAREARNALKRLATPLSEAARAQLRASVAAQLMSPPEVALDGWGRGGGAAGAEGFGAPTRIALTSVREKSGKRGCSCRV